MSSWRPSASLPMLQARAKLLSQIREFFAQRDVLEVETPVLAAATVSDLHIESWKTANQWGSDPQPYYLQTSPEYAMKRLLAADSGAIYQLSKAFRFEEKSDRHNPEFSLLEWYQPGYSLTELMDEVEALVTSVSTIKTINRYSYRKIFLQNLSIDPHSASTTELESLVKSKINLVAEGLGRTDYLQLLLGQVIEPAMQGNWFLYDYPAEQAALASIKTDHHGTQVAERFELFCSGMEIANGYFELTDAEEQRRRFRQDIEKRAIQKKDKIAIDEKLISALESGLPECAGVALGVDRLLMIATGADRIDDVIAFPTNLA
ncbi:MAG: EF-P lysine aminoacylase EpmA [Pseudohongiellaceae bacterium]